MDNDIVFYLCQLPATDGNFKISLRRAKEDEIRCAIEKMQKDTDGKHKSRILACERELRKREK